MTTRSSRARDRCDQRERLSSLKTLDLCDLACELRHRAMYLSFVHNRVLWSSRLARVPFR